MEEEFKCKHNVHGYGDIVSVKLLKDGNVALRVSDMQGFYVGGTAILDREEVKRLMKMLHRVWFTEAEEVKQTGRF